MDELIARLEAATGPDQELDAAIFAAVYPEQVPSPIVESGYGWRFDRSYWWLATGEDARVMPKTVSPAKFTASIDAALTLVPEGWAVRLKQTTRYDQTCWTGDGQQPAWTVSLMPDDNKADNFMFYEHGGAATPALAICIAAIRARGDA